MLDVDQLQEANGSVGHSPSATAYFATYVRPADEKALAYLYSVVSSEGSVPDLFPFEIYERAWVLWNLALVDNPSIYSMPEFQRQLDFLANAWNPEKGVGLSLGFSVPDGDNTSVTFDLLKKFGRNVDINGLFSFLDDSYFRCYDLEANISVSVNIHSLAALRQAGYSFDDPIVADVVQLLAEKQTEDGYWFDKWHISPYYTTAHAILALREYDPPMLQRSIDWVVKTQRSDGSWGYFMPTPEETAYCIQALCDCRRRGRAIQKGAIAKGRDFLLVNMDAPHPLFWIGKGLYASEPIIRSEILSALEMAEGE
jgi:hypothetical protein